MNRWTAEGGRSMTIYAGAWCEAFWLVLALAVVGWARLREWAAQPGMAVAEAVGCGAMLAWAAGLIVLLAIQ